MGLGLNRSVSGKVSKRAEMPFVKPNGKSSLKGRYGQFGTQYFFGFVVDTMLVSPIIPPVRDRRWWKGFCEHQFTLSPPLLSQRQV
jgi:hypothetical protein